MKLNIFAIGLLAVGMSAHAAPIVLVTDFSDPARLGRLDLGTGVYSPYATTNVGEIFNGPGGSIVGFRENGDFVRVNGGTGVTTFVGPSGIQIDEPAQLADGTIYTTDVGHRLYTVNPATGATTLRGSTGFVDPAGGAFFVALLAGQTNTLYAIATSVNLTTFDPIDHARLFKIDRNTGAPTFVANVANDFVTCGILIGGKEYLFDFLGGVSTLNLTTGGVTPLYDLSATVGGIHGVASVPEPGTFAMGGLALLALGLLRRKMQAQPEANYSVLEENSTPS